MMSRTLAGLTFLLALAFWVGLPAQAQDNAVVPSPSPRPAIEPLPGFEPRYDGGAVARQLFGRTPTPAPLAARSIGGYARGCLAGAMPLAVDGPAWQAMHLSRNRNWGHPELVAYQQTLAVAGRADDGWIGLLVGDMSQPRGGPMLTGHRSHQIGLDADIWLTPMPDRTLSVQEREEISAISMLRDGTRIIDPARWTEAHARIIRRAARDDRVARSFVHPAIKDQLCSWENVSADRAWLRRIRPWYGHHYHFHVRLSCPEGMASCVNQNPPPAGDGCGEELAWWLGPEPWQPSDTPARPRPETTLADLPAMCSQVLVAN
ncbi:MAG: penicillin-insensitive murein endopeptidase [Cohaesibacteraceae bacterium]